MIGKETVRGMSSRSVLHAWIVITLCIPHMHYAGGLACRSTLLRRDTTYPLPPSFPPPLPLSSCSPSPLPSLSPVSRPPPSHPYPLLLPVFSPAAPPSRHLIDRLKMSISQRCWHVTSITHSVTRFSLRANPTRKRPCPTSINPTARRMVCTTGLRMHILVKLL